MGNKLITFFFLLNFLFSNFSVMSLGSIDIEDLLHAGLGSEDPRMKQP